MVILVFAYLASPLAVPAQQAQFEACTDSRPKIVSIKPIRSSIRFRSQVLKNGSERVLSLPIEIRNLSSVSISSLLNHEWPGGIWPESELEVSVRGLKDRDWATLPGFLAGESDVENLVKILPGDAAQVNVRLNWSGTGSMPVFFPLIRKRGTYLVQFRLNYWSGLAKGCVESPEFTIRVTG